MFLSLCFLSSIIIYSLYVQSQRLANEPFINKDEETNPNRNTMTSIVLLGDSILKNNAYVNPKYSVEKLLTTSFNKKTYYLAKDNTDIKSVYEQVKNIPSRLNTVDTAIFLSIGGNDLLKTNSSVENIFQQYEQLVRDIKIHFNKCKIVVMNVYISPSIQKNFILRNKIIQWNKLLKAYTLKKNIDLITLDTLLYKQEDFVEQYEPSEVGGVKIVKAIMLNVS
jgi:hypothetical protein